MGDSVPSTSSANKKRKNENAPNEDDPSPKRTPLKSSSKAENVVSSAGLKNSLHGNIFQLKLLYLFLMRGLEAGYDFQLATERPDLGDKFDDLVFKFWPDKSNQSEFKIRFVQAKHKQSNNEIITAANLLNTTDDDFSLVKYFRSFRHIWKENSKNLLDIVICCNAGFDLDNLQKKGFSLTSYQHSNEEKFFTSDATLHSLNLEKTNVHVQKLLVNLKQCSITHLLADEIIKCFTVETTLTLNNSLFKLYHFALVEERVLRLFTTEKILTNRKKNTKTKEKKFLAEFHDDFKEKRNLSKGASALYEVLCKEKEWEQLKVFQFETSSTFGKKSKKKHDDLINLPSDFVEDSEIDEFFKNGKETSSTFGKKSKKKHDVLINLPSDFVEDSEIDEFFKKLVFAKVPSEVELGKILTISIGKLDGLNNSCLQSAFVLEKILNWFKTKESKFMTAKEGLDILKEKEEKIKALQYTYNSLHYQEIVMEDKFSFRPEAIQPMANRLETFLSDDDSQVLHIFTISCELSCIKLHFALQCLVKFEQKDSYWMLPYSDFKKKENFTLLKEMMKSVDSPNLLVVVDAPPDFNVSDIVQKQKKVALLTEGREAISEKIHEKKVKVESDEIHWKDLSKESQGLLFNISVNFQGETNFTVKTLIQSDEPTQIIDSSSILQLYLNYKKGIDVGVAPPVPPQYDTNLYIDRRLVFPLSLAQFKDCAVMTPGFQEKFTLSPEGNIVWLTSEFVERRSLWENFKKNIKQLFNEMSVSEKCILSESEMLRKTSMGKIVIVSDIPGMGKSALLTHLYEQIKRAESHTWVIRINLIDCANVLYKVNGDLLDQANSAIDFLINNVMESSLKKNRFAETLFRRRVLETGGVVLMLDGFDEMQNICQVNAVRLMKTLLNQTSTDRIYVTTRPHMKDDLEDNFFHLAFLLEEFNKEDQENCLRKYWNKQLKKINNVGEFENKEERIARFAEKVVQFAGKKLTDKERSFSGIPLHCRMLAECFETNLIEGLKTDQEITVHSPLEDSITFNLASLYRLFLQTKWDILQEDKKKTDPINFFINDTVEKELYEHFSFFQGLGIETLLPDKEDAEALWNNFLPKKLMQLCSNSSINFGLTEKTANNELRFFHRTFAEFFTAYHIITIFETEDNSTPNNQPAQDVIIKKILNDKLFGGVRSFLDSMMENIIPSAEISWPFDREKPVPLLLRKSFNCRFVSSQLCSMTVNFQAYPHAIESDLITYEEVYDSEGKFVTLKEVSTEHPHKPKEDLVSSSNEGTKKFIEQVLYVVTQEGHANILGWLLYCAKESILRRNEGEITGWADEMRFFLDPSKVCLALGFNKIDNISYIFQRYLMWFNDTYDPKVLTDLFDSIFLALFRSIILFDFSRHNGASEAEILLGFMKHHRNTLGSEYLKLKNSDEPFILTTLLMAYDIKNLDDTKIATICETVLTRLADMFENIPGAFAKTLERWFLCSYKSSLIGGGIRVNGINDGNWIAPSILQFYSSSVVLHTLGYLSTLTLDEEAKEFLNSQIVKQTIGLALQIDPLAMVRLETTISHIESNAFKLSPLQIAAMHGYVDTIQNILINNKSNKLEVAKDLTQNDYGISPLYLAVSCIREEACKVILAFLKETQYEFQSIEDLIANKNCFYNALNDAASRTTVISERIIECYLNVVEATYSSEGVFKLLREIQVRESGENITIFKLVIKFDMYHVISRMIEMSFEQRYFSDLVNEENNNLFFNLTFPKPSISNMSVQIAKKVEEDTKSQTTCFKNVLTDILYWKKENEILDLFFAINRSGDATIDMIVIIFCSPIAQDFVVDKLFGTSFPYFVELLTKRRKYVSGHSSVWTEYCTQPGTSVAFINTILDFIYNGHGNKNVIEMAFHNDGNGEVIELAKKFGRDDVVLLMRNHLVKEKYNRLPQLDDRLRNIVREKNDRHDWLSLV